MNAKADDFEYQILDFLDELMKIAGVEDTATFTRSYIVNTQEEVTTVISAAQFTGDDYTTEKVLTLLGDGDKAQEILKQKDADEISGFNQPAEETEEEQTDDDNQADDQEQ